MVVVAQPVARLIQKKRPDKQAAEMSVVEILNGQYPESV